MQGVHMAAYRLSVFVLVALVPALLTSACVNLTAPWAGATDASFAGATETGGSPVGTGGMDTGGTTGLACVGAGGSDATADLGGATAVGSGGVGLGGSTDLATGGTGAADTGGSTATGGVTGTGGVAADVASATGGGTSPGDAAPPDSPLGKDGPTGEVPRDLPKDLPGSPDLPLTFDTPLPLDGVDSGVSSLGLVAYYKCDETLGTTLSDSSGNGKDGALIGPAGFGTGEVGNALLLTATNGIDGGASGGYAQLPAGLLASTRTLTVAAWFKINSTIPFQRVFDFGTSSTTSSMYLTPRNATGLPQFSIRLVPEAGAEIKENVISTGAAIAANAWHHAAIVVDATGGHLYIDGALVGGNTSMTLRPADLGAMPNDWIGRSEFPNDPYFDGDIDEFRVYNRALSSAEVLALFSGQ